MLRSLESLEIVVDVTVNNKLSSAVDIESAISLGLIMPTLDSTNVTFYVSDNLAGTYVQVKDKGGTTALTVAAGVGDWAVEADDLVGLIGYRWLKINCESAQAADRTFILTRKI